MYNKHSLVRKIPSSSIRCSGDQPSIQKFRLLSKGNYQIHTQTIKSKTFLPIEMETNEEAKKDILIGLTKGTVLAVSDGSLKSSFGTGAFVLYNQETGKILRGCVISYGRPSDQSAYRSELIGLSAIITFITTNVDKHNLTNVNIQIACDGKSALENIFDEWKSKTKTNMKHYDIISYARALIHKSQVKWSARHVYGHRDAITTELTIWEKLNVIADELATKFWIQQKFRYQNTLNLSDGFPTVSQQGEAVCSKLRKTIQQRSNFSDWYKWWETKQTEKGRQSTNLDLRSMKLAFLKLNDAMKRWVMKHSHGTCGVNVWLHRWKQLASPICERCECHDETALHIWKCEKSKEWHSIINSWEGWLRRYNCPEPDIEAYTATWQSWRRNVTSIRLSNEISVPMRIALTDQNKIGWDKMAFGYISIHWSTVLASWRGNKYAPSPQQLIKQIWKAGHKLWDERNGWIHNDTRIKQIKREVR